MGQFDSRPIACGLIITIGILMAKKIQTKSKKPKSGPKPATQTRAAEVSREKVARRRTPPARR